MWTVSYYPLMCWVDSSFESSQNHRPLPLNIRYKVGTLRNRIVSIGEKNRLLIIKNSHTSHVRFARSVLTFFATRTRTNYICYATRSLRDK